MSENEAIEVLKQIEIFADSEIDCIACPFAEDCSKSCRGCVEKALRVLINRYEQLEKELEPIRELGIPVETLVAEFNRLEDIEDDREQMQLIINELRKDSIPKSAIREEIEKLERDEEKIREKKKYANDYDRSKARMQAYLTKTNEIKKRLEELLGDEQ